MMIRAFKTLVLVAVVATVAYWVGLNADEWRLLSGKATPSAADRAAEAKRAIGDLKNENAVLTEENEKVRLTAINVLSTLQKSVVSTSGKVSDETSKLMSREELGDKLIELGKKLKEER